MKKSILFLLLVVLCNILQPQSKWFVEKDSLNFAILISDYQTYNFEKGNLTYYAAIDSIVNNIPMECKFEPPVDFGNISFFIAKNKDTLFSASILWQGLGKINYPKEFQPADSFSISQEYIQQPLSIEYYFNNIAQLDTAVYNLKADSAWAEIKNLDLVNEFAKYPYRIGLYLYTPGEAVYVQNTFINTYGAKWIVFLFYDNSTISGIDYSEGIPIHYKLLQNYPNPFNPATVISYQLSAQSFVTLKVFDLLGREVATLVNEEKPAGSYSVNFDAANLTSGIYLYRLTAGSYSSVKKMILLR